MFPQLNIKILLGRILTKIEGATVGSDEILLIFEDNSVFKLYHQQECCERVRVEDICGDISDLIGCPLTMAEESDSHENPPGMTFKYQDSFTWTFYKFATVKGYVTIRWYGESNGYYSESVTFCEIIK